MFFVMAYPPSYTTQQDCDELLKHEAYAPSIDRVSEPQLVSRRPRSSPTSRLYTRPHPRFPLNWGLFRGTWS